MGELVALPDAVLACALAPKALKIENGFCTPVSGRERCEAVLKPIDSGVQTFAGEQSLLRAGGSKVDVCVWDDVAVGVWGTFENLDYLRGKVEVEGEPKEAELVARLFRKFGEAASLTKIWGELPRPQSHKGNPTHHCGTHRPVRRSPGPSRLTSGSEPPSRPGQFSFIACDLKNDRVFAARSTLSPVELIEARSFCNADAAALVGEQLRALSSRTVNMPCQPVAAARNSLRNALSCATGAPRR